MAINKKNLEIVVSKLKVIESCRKQIEALHAASGAVSTDENSRMLNIGIAINDKMIVSGSMYREGAIKVLGILLIDIEAEMHECIGFLNERGIEIDL